MTNKKYTDEQIVRALRSWISSHDCDIICIKELMNCDECLVELLKQTFFLINRQKAEIETARAEAIEEFAERLKETMTTQTTDNINEPCVNIIYYADETIDEIAKELTEGQP